MDSRYYPDVEADIPQLSAELRNLFDSEYEVQTFQVSTTGVIQARKSSTLRDLTGFFCTHDQDHTGDRRHARRDRNAEVVRQSRRGCCRRRMVFPPLLALAALGAYWQYKITEDAWKIIEDHIARKAGGYVPPLPGRCGTCGAANVAGSDFCPSSCGANLKVGRSCPHCGAPQKEISARFCNRCGNTA